MLGRVTGWLAQYLDEQWNEWMVGWLVVQLDGQVGERMFGWVTGWREG